LPRRFAGCLGNPAERRETICEGMDRRRNNSAELSSRVSFSVEDSRAIDVQPAGLAGAK
jgi:hypothetical protein